MDEAAHSGRAADAVGAADDSEADISREKIRRGGFKEFVKQAWAIVEGSRPLKWSWHLDAICDHLQALHEGRLEKHKLLVNVPPRTSKSTIVTVMFPCWVWTQNPNLSFVFASYAFNLSRDHAYKRRSILESAWYKERWGHIIELAGDRNNITEMANTAKGMMYTTSIGGSTTGRGGDYLILDDPNDAEQMESEVQRASTLRWIDVTWSTRMNDPKNYREILIQQRTHTQDVTGHVLSKQPDQWVWLRIPMEYNPEKPCRTPIWCDPRQTKNDLLDEERFPRKFIEERKISLGPYFYAGQYDQEPYPLGGGVIKSAWLHPWKKSDKQPGYLSVLDGQYHFDPWAAFRFCTVDPAITEQEIGEKKLSDPDYTVIAAWCAFWSHKRTVLCLLDLFMARMEGPAILPKIQSMHDYWKFSIIGVETVAFQKMLFQLAKKQGLPVREISTKNDEEAIYRIDKDKMARAMSATPLMADGRFHVPEYAPWLSEFSAQLTQFPNAGHDDCVDVSAFAVAIAEKYVGHVDLGVANPIPRGRISDGINRMDDEDSSAGRSAWDAIRVRSPHR